MVCKMKAVGWKRIIFLIAGIALLAVFSVCFRSFVDAREASLSQIDLEDSDTVEGGNFSLHEGIRLADLGNDNLLNTNSSRALALNSSAATVEFGGTTTDYESFAEAWSAATSASTSADSQAKITLYADVDPTEYQTATVAQTTSYTYLRVESGKYITLDLNGHTIDRGLPAATSNGHVIRVVGNLTVQSRYRGENFSDSAHYMKVPFAVKIKSERGKKYAKELIHILMNRMHIELGQTSTLFSAAEYPYSTQKSLIDRGLIKVYYSEQIPENSELISQKVVIRERISANEAHSLIQDQALELIQPSAKKRERGKRLSINIDTLGASFAAGDTVDIDILKEKKLIPKTADSVKILARGILDKPLAVIADDFSVDAVKMIVLTGDKAIQR